MRTSSGSPYPLAIAARLFAFSTAAPWPYYGLKGWTFLFAPEIKREIDRYLRRVKSGEIVNYRQQMLPTNREQTVKSTSPCCSFTPPSFTYGSQLGIRAA